MRHRIIYLGLLTLGIFSCSNGLEVADREEVVIVLPELTDFYIQLDGETSTFNNIYQAVDTDSLPLLFLFNQLNMNLYLYDLSNGELKDRLVFEEKGPNGLGSRVTSFNVLNDSSIVFHSYYKGELIYTDWKGKVSSRYPLNSNDFDYFPKSSVKHPFVRFDEELYFYSGKSNSGAAVVGFKPFPLLYKYENANGSFINMLLPELYKTDNGYYFPSELSIPSIGVNFHDELLVVSLPLDDSVRILKRNGEVESKFFGNQRHRLRRPLRLTGSRTNPNDVLKNIHRFSQYEMIRYDPYNEMYVRTFFEPTPENMLKENKVQPLNSKIMFANKNFEILGEARYSVVSDNVFFMKEGLLQVIITNSEDSLLIKRYSTSSLKF